MENNYKTYIAGTYTGLKTQFQAASMFEAHKKAATFFRENCIVWGDNTYCYEIPSSEKVAKKILSYAESCTL